ncbi:MAG: hypothetical protein ACRCZ0_08955 [Cetobacterium sp.]
MGGIKIYSFEYVFEIEKQNLNNYLFLLRIDDLKAAEIAIDIIMVYTLEKINKELKKGFSKILNLKTEYDSIFVFELKNINKNINKKDIKEILDLKIKRVETFKNISNLSDLEAFKFACNVFKVKTMDLYIETSKKGKIEDLKGTLKEKDGIEFEYRFIIW